MDKVILAAIPLFFSLIGLEMFFSWKKKKKFYELKDSITSLGSGILNQMNSLIARPLSLLIYVAVYEYWNVDQALGKNYFTADLTKIAGIVTWIFGFVFTDFLFYWQHRHSHEINVMWATHIAHHSSEEYNLSTALRQPAFGFLVTMHYIVPAAILGVPPLVYFASMGLNLVYQFWIHTRFIKKMGPFEWFMNTPSHHRVHHARQQKYLDKNYAGVFIIWDRMFGTFIEEQEEPKYGIYPRYTKYNAVSANIDPWIELFKYFNQAQGFKNKMSVLFKGPLYIYENFKKGNVPAGLKPARDKKAAWFVLPFFLLSLGVALVALFQGTNMAIVGVVALFTAVWIMTYFIGYLQDTKSV